MNNSNNWADSFSLGMMRGYGIGERMNENRIREEVGKASGTYSPTEQMAAADVQENIAKNFVPQEGGPQTAAEFIQQTPGLADIANSQKQQWNVNGANYDTRDAAASASRGLNMQAMADTYRKNGRPEDALRMEAQSQEHDLRGIQLSEAKDKAGATAQYRNVLTTLNDPIKAAEYFKAQYNANQVGGPDHDQYNLEFKPVKGGFMAWQTTKDGETVPGSSKYFDKDEVVREAQTAYLQRVDPTGAMKLDIDAKNRADDREWDREKFGETKRHTRVQEDISRQQLGISGAASNRAEREFVSREDERKTLTALAEQASGALAGMDAARKENNAEAYNTYNASLREAQLRAKAMGRSLALDESKHNQYHFNVVKNDDGTSMFVAGNTSTGQAIDATPVKGKPGLSGAGGKQGAGAVDPAVAKRLAEIEAKGRKLFQ